MNPRNILFGVLAVGVLAAAVYAVQHVHPAAQALRLSGNVDIREVNLAFRVPGRLQRLAVDEGDRVHPGDLLGELDAEPYAIALRDATASHAALLAHRALYRAGYRREDIAQAAATLEARLAAERDSEQAWQRQLKLADTGASTEKALDDARAQRDQAHAQSEVARQQLKQLRHGFRPQEVAEASANEQRAQAQVEQARLQLADTRLVAPAAGTVITRAAEPGTMLASGTTVLTVSLDAPVWVRAYAGETELGRLASGTAVKVWSDSRAQPYEGIVGFVSPTAEFTPKNVETQDLRTALVYRLRVVVTHPDAALHQGMPVTVTLAGHD